MHPSLRHVGGIAQDPIDNRTHTMHRITLRLPDNALDALTQQSQTSRRKPADLARHLLMEALGLPDAPKLNPRQNPKLKGI